MGVSHACSCVLQEKSDTAPKTLVIQSSSPSTEECPKNIESWDFNVLELDEQAAQKAAAWLLLHKRGSCSAPEAEKQQLFSQEVCSGYLPNPYHNVLHAVDVMHAVWRCGELMPWGQVYQSHEQYALIVAALSHDIGHFGLTNVFLVDMRDELALCYNDKSPLENMHCSKLFLILSAERTNVLSHLAPQDLKDVRKMIIEAILHTDPVNHGAMVNDLTALLTSNEEVIAAQPLDQLSKEVAELFSANQNKILIARTMLHGADLSNPAKPWNVTFAWAQAVVSEFFAQGDQEKALGLPVGMLNDRTTVSLPNSQLGFIQFMVAPFVAAYVKIFRNWQELASMLSFNVGEWGRLHFEESGKDESGRVNAVRECLRLESALELKDADPKAIEDANPQEQGQIVDGSDAKEGMAFEEVNQNPPNNQAVAKIKTVEKRHAVVREVRRWRQTQDKNSFEKGQHRELVLLYVLSDGEVIATDGKDLIMKFSGYNSHFKTPEPTPREEDPDGANVVTVAVAADNMRSQLDRENFDHLLSKLLEKKLQY